MKKTKKKAYIILVSAVLVLGIVLGGTVAYLSSLSDVVTNTFTIGDVNITLTEHALEADGKTLGSTISSTGENNYNFVPGDVLPKDPTINIDTTSEPCWLFVKAIESQNTHSSLPTGDQQIIKWAINTTDQTGGKWTKLSGVTGVDNVWYCKIDNPATTSTVQVLTGTNGGTIQVNSGITKEMRNAIFASKPILKFKAAAIQQANIGSGDDTAKAKAAYEQLPTGFKDWTGA
ncbi:MAG: SipW-dependent-type signal peptide-containing protein [Acutalibacteraceae bacterium]